MKTYEYTMGKVLDLKEEQKKTLAAPGLDQNIVLRVIYWCMDIIYGKGRSLGKLKVLEILARYPYWAWEICSYHSLTRSYVRGKEVEINGVDARLRHIEMGRKSQDNEQWHMMLIEDIMRQKGIKQSWLKGTVLAYFMAFVYHYFTRVLYFFKPEWSFAMNASFESHAEKQYMLMVQEHPEWEEEEVETHYFQHYPRQATLADLFRRIALDERDHKFESCEEYERITGHCLC